MTGTLGQNVATVNFFAAISGKKPRREARQSDREEVCRANSTSPGNFMLAQKS